MRGREVVTRLAHNQEIVGSNPTPATKNIELTYRQQRMMKFHLEGRDYLYKDGKIKFDEPIFAKNCKDTIISKSKKEIYITRHLLTAECTHSLVLKDECYDRYSDEELN